MVTYSTCSAPFLALRVIKQLVEDEGEQFLLASLVLLHDTFVNDILFGAHIKSDALKIRQELIALFGKAKLDARKWMSNSQKLFDSANHGLAWIAPGSENDGINILDLKRNPTTNSF